MKNLKYICILVLFITFLTITISQVTRRTYASTPITAPISWSVTPTPTPTPDNSPSPITSAVTPTPTVTPTVTPTPTQTNNQESNNSGNSGSSNSGSSNSSGGSNSNGPTQCNSTKPAVPFITSIGTAPKNGVTITWTKNRENTTYYLIAYSRIPGVIEYATGNLSADSNRFTIYGLGRQTFYFKVRAGNGCMPGDFSPEVGFKNGKMVYVPTYAPKQKVLGTSQKVQINKNGSTSKNQPIPYHEEKSAKSNNPQPQANTPTGFWGFLGKIFSK